MNVLEEQIRLYARQLKLPAFGEYQQFLRQAEPDLDFGGLLLELMKAELTSVSCQEKCTQYRHKVYQRRERCFATKYIKGNCDLSNLVLGVACETGHVKASAAPRLRRP